MLIELNLNMSAGAFVHTNSWHDDRHGPRDGTEVVRTYQLTRWSNGRYTLWSGRNRTTGAGEGRSNFRTDVVLPVGP